MRGAVYVNGKIAPADQAEVPVYDHGFVYGEGVYETLRTYNRVPFLYDRHMREGKGLDYDVIFAPGCAYEDETSPEILTALKRLVTFTWDYYLANPEFITLVNSENLHKARHIGNSAAMDAMNRPFVARMQALLERGSQQGLFRPGLDPVQILIVLSGVGFHYLTNRYTGAIVYGRDLMSEQAKAARLAFNIDAVLRIICRPEVLMQLEAEQ